MYVRVRLLGGMTIEGACGPVAGPAAQRHRLALLAVLVASHPRGVPRDRLLALLWPERDDSCARNLLNQAVYALRSVLGQDRIRSLSDELKIEPDRALECDLLQLRDALANGRVERAVSRYGGPFLDGFFLPGSKAFEEWAAGERDGIERAYRAALEERARECRDASEAVGWWRRLALMAPDCARITLALMGVLEAAGDRGGALRLAQQHEARLREEFDAEPNPEVVALAERIRTHPRGPVASGTWSASGDLH